MRTFKAGMVVALVSGGPPMTISRTRRSRSLAECIWFDLEGRMRRHTFPLALLHPVAAAHSTSDVERLPQPDRSDGPSTVADSEVPF